MALNWVQLDPQGGRRPLMLPGERTVEKLSDTSLHLEIPPTLAGPKQEIKGNADMWLTNKRIVLLSSGASPPAGPSLVDSVYSIVNSFIASTPSTDNSGSKMDSITIPYSSIRDITFEQGLFTPNGLGLQFVPVPEGNFPQLGRNSFIKLNIALKEGRVYDIWKRARELWEESSRKAVEEDTLPRYTPN